MKKLQTLSPRGSAVLIPVVWETSVLHDDPSCFAAAGRHPVTNLVRWRCVGLGELKALHTVYGALAPMTTYGDAGVARHCRLS